MFSSLTLKTKYQRIKYFHIRILILKKLIVLWNKKLYIVYDLILIFD